MKLKLAGQSVWYTQYYRIYRQASLSPYQYVVLSILFQNCIILPSIQTFISSKKFMLPHQWYSKIPPGETSDTCKKCELFFSLEIPPYIEPVQGIVIDLQKTISYAYNIEKTL